MAKPRRRYRYIRKSWHKPRGGTMPGSVKLKPEDVRYIKRVIKLEERIRKVSGSRRRPNGFFSRLGAKFGVTKWTVKKIAQDLRWRNMKVTLPPVVEISRSSSPGRWSVRTSWAQKR